MYYDDNLPAGAANDPRAPYNEIDLVEVYREEIDEAVDDELHEQGGVFAEWLYNNDFLPDDAKCEESTTDAIIHILSEDEKVKDLYYQFRCDDLANEFAEKANDEMEGRLEEYYMRLEEY